MSFAPRAGGPPATAAAREGGGGAARCDAVTRPTYGHRKLLDAYASARIASVSSPVGRLRSAEVDSVPSRSLQPRVKKSAALSAAACTTMWITLIGGSARAPAPAARKDGTRTLRTEIHSGYLRCESRVSQKLASNGKGQTWLRTDLARLKVRRATVCRSLLVPADRARRPERRAAPYSYTTSAVFRSKDARTRGGARRGRAPRDRTAGPSRARAVPKVIHDAMRDRRRSALVSAALEWMSAGCPRPPAVRVPPVAAVHASGRRRRRPSRALEYTS
ncbi:hypothetical protein EVAR_92725_1 [Eumeta japonica]|uniref:Uncharacterized protein n=1 Tax=Eumeta variegata TaxID=151549 RepID=A0A4C1T046_EUMVA|nr:hypothetical protein EVAR_92725_1 [Eumeta japonica]